MKHLFLKTLVIACVGLCSVAPLNAVLVFEVNGEQRGSARLDPLPGRDKMLRYELPPEHQQASVRLTLPLAQRPLIPGVAFRENCIVNAIMAHQVNLSIQTQPATEARVGEEVLTPEDFWYKAHIKKDARFQYIEGESPAMVRVPVQGTERIERHHLWDRLPEMTREGPILWRVFEGEAMQLGPFVVRTKFMAEGRPLMAYQYWWESETTLAAHFLNVSHVCCRIPGHFLDPADVLVPKIQAAFPLAEKLALTCMVWRALEIETKMPLEKIARRLQRPYKSKWAALYKLVARTLQQVQEIDKVT